MRIRASPAPCNAKGYVEMGASLQLHVSLSLQKRPLGIGAVAGHDAVSVARAEARRQASRPRKKGACDRKWRKSAFCSSVSPVSPVLLFAFADQVHLRKGHGRASSKGAPDEGVGVAESCGALVFRRRAAVGVPQNGELRVVSSGSEARGRRVPRDAGRKHRGHCSAGCPSALFGLLRFGWRKRAIDRPPPRGARGACIVPPCERREKRR